MRILLLSTAFGSKDGGLGTRALTLAEAWTQMGADVTVLTSARGPAGEPYATIRISLPGHYFPRALVLAAELFCVLKKKQVDGVFCIGWSPEGLAAFLSAWVFKIPWIVSVNGFDICDALGKRHTRLLSKLVFRRAHHIVSPTRFLAGKIDRLGAGTRQMSIVSNGVDTQRFSPVGTGLKSRAADRKNAPVLLAVGRLHPIKGLDTLIEAFAGLAADFPDAKLIIAGSGPQEKGLVRLVRRRKLEERVVFTGWVDNRELPNLYRSADIVVQPSRVMGEFEEGQGITLLEAAACGKPAVGSRSGGIPEVINEGVTGLLAAADDPVDLRAKIQHLLERPEMCTQMGRNAAMLAKEAFDGKLNAEKILQLFQHGGQGRCSITPDGGSKLGNDG
jgi:phosphatidylinositol alpha-1,6-mannosyltransferase